MGLSFDEVAAKLDQLGREREALELSYQDLNRDFVDLTARVKSAKVDAPAPEVASLLRRFSTALELQREQVDLLWQLLGDALQGGAEGE